MAKVFVFGIDGAPPEYVLDKWLDELPNIKGILSNAIYGKMKSSVPPSTIVAWTSMLSGKDPSFFDVYTYTYKDSLNQTRLTNSTNIKAKRIWKYLDEVGKKTVAISVPLTYPVEKLNGVMVSGFLTPLFNEKSVYPSYVKEEIMEKLGQEYAFDVEVGLAGYKNLDTEQMIAKAYSMTDMQVKLTKDFIKSKGWDFFMSVFLASDRMQHTMWRFHDPTHRKHPGASKYENTLKEYYIYLDKAIGEIKDMLGDDVYFIIASDHGFDRMDGRFNLNDWLIKEGYLILKEKGGSAERLDFTKVDWAQTRVYAIGAYFGRIYFNRVSRDAEQGIVREEDVAALQEELIGKLKLIRNDVGEEIDTKFFRPQEVYAGPYMEKSPDLYVYFDNLRWGVNNDVGNIGLYSLRTTRGSDDAGHAPKGMFVLSHPSIVGRRDDSIEITDVLPTIFKIMGVEIPADMKGRVLV